MRIVTICSSVRFEKNISEAYRAMKNAGYKILSPEKEAGFVLKPNEHQKIQLAKQHFKAMNESDFIYFICEDGYLGTSCKLELGYAIALRKPIYFSRKTGDIALDAWAKEFVPITDIGNGRF